MWWYLYLLSLLAHGCDVNILKLSRTLFHSQLGYSGEQDHQVLGSKSSEGVLSSEQSVLSPSAHITPCHM